jgi:hypothetical protein
VHDGASNRNNGGVGVAVRGKPDDQLTLFVAEKTPFPEKLYRRLTDGGAPFQEFTGTLGGKRTVPQREYWFPFHCPADWNGFWSSPAIPPFTKCGGWKSTRANTSA